MRKYQREVEERLLTRQKSIAPPRWKAEDYVGGGQSRLRYLDLKIPLVRAEYKRGFSFSDEPAEKQWEIWNYIWNQSRIFEVMLMASYWAASRPLTEVLEHRQKILGWLDKVDNWGHSDELSAHYARLLEADPDQLWPHFEKWNASDKPWLKRQSMVGLFFYSRLRRRWPPVKRVLSYIERHLADSHYYVQKAVGWALREAWNVYPRETFAFLKKHAASIPPAGWTAATEKLNVKDKEILTSLRQAARSRANRTARPRLQNGRSKAVRR